MIATDLSYLPKYFTQKSIIAFFVILFFCLIFFTSKQLPIECVLFNCIEVFSFFYFSNKITKKWDTLSVTIFKKKLLYTSLGIRIAWVIFSYVFYTVMTGEPFEFEAADSKGYNQEGIWLSILLQKHKLAEYIAYVGKNFADMGYAFYLGMLYYIVGSNVFIARLIKAILGSYTCLLVYKIARNNFGETTGRMAGILTMLVPNLIYYCGLHVKETEMIFLTVAFVYLADKLVRSPKINPRDIVFICLITASLFFFRTVLIGCLIGSVVMATLFTSRRISSLNKRFLLVLLLLMGVFLIASTPIVDDIYEHLEASDQNLTSQMDSFATRQDGNNKFSRYGSRSVFLPFMVVAPFPTLVDTSQPNAMMLGGAYFTRNVYAFFVFVGIFVLYKRKQLRYHVLILSVLFSYMFVLSSSGFALSERFHLPLIPFLLILVAYGISQMNQKNKKFYIPYLLLVSIIVIGWNWFKLAGRS